MNDRPTPRVGLKMGGNPWPGTLSNDAVRQQLYTAALGGEKQIKAWINEGKITVSGDEDAVFAQVFLDPTNPRSQTTIQRRVFAIVLYGDPAYAMQCLPNATAKADAADRHGGRRSGELVNRANFCLGDDDFAWGSSAFYEGAISAGSGLSAEQDEQLAQLTLEIAMDSINLERADWIEERRRGGGSQGWYNKDNRPGEQYRWSPLVVTEWLTPDRYKT